MRISLFLLTLLTATAAAAQTQSGHRPTHGQSLVVGTSATGGMIAGMFAGGYAGLQICESGRSCGIVPGKAILGGLVGGIVGSALGAHTAHRKTGRHGSVFLASAGTLLGGLAGYIVLGRLNAAGAMIGGVAGGVLGGTHGYGLSGGGSPHPDVHSNLLMGAEGQMGISLTTHF